ncbi:MAG: YCF48-related protein [Bacteroidota bacterium]|jgi:photosystem II stability/assembly factor-like uncharacterized protein
MKSWIPHLLIVLAFMAGCINQPEKRPVVDQPPVTYFWIFPDSTILEGNSKQHIRWWGQDPDGIVVGYLFASGKFLTSSKTIPYPDTVAWGWTTATDSIVTFPLRLKRDTFDIAIRAVDNQFKQTLPQQAVVRFSSKDSLGVHVTIPYWDVNMNARFDSGDIVLPSMAAAVDPKGAVQPVPLLNQPPTVVFAQDPNNPSVVMQQPDTTFTVATFAWVGTDPDGNQTIADYEFALNDTGKPANWVSVPGSVNLITLVVPRQRSDVGDSTANIYIGSSFLATRLIGIAPGLRLNAFNRFFLRARDIAGDASKIISMPDTGKRWFVKKPQGRLLIVNDYINNVAGQASAVKAFYRDTVFGVYSPIRNVINQKFSGFDMIDIARGLSAGDKSNSKVGAEVPPFIDPAFVFTLHLFDVVFWYTDPFPSLTVAQVPLYDYLHPGVYPHTGKVIYSAMFQSNTDPRRALRDFAPIDSVSSVDLLDQGSNGSFIFPRFGDTQISGSQGYWVYPDSTDLSDVYPTLKFRMSFSLALYLNPVHKRADARYIYRIQDYVSDGSSSIVHYDTMITLNELRSISLQNTEAWACGTGGVIFHTTNSGDTWEAQASGLAASLESIQMVNQNDGWCVGDSGRILETDNGGTTWNDVSIPSPQDLNGAFFVSPTTGVIVGSNGLIIRTTDGGGNWESSPGVTGQNLYSVSFLDANNGIAVGDTEIVLRTVDGGVDWKQVYAGNLGNPYRLYAGKMVDAAVGYAVGGRGTVLKTTDSAKTWQRFLTGRSDTLRSMYFFDENTGLVCGTGGTILKTTDGGHTWSPPNTAIVTQNLNALGFAGTQQGLAVGGSILTRKVDLTLHPGGGIILQTGDGGSTWQLKPRGGLYVGVIDGDKQFVFLGLPLHLLNGDGVSALNFLQHVLFTEFGF